MSQAQAPLMWLVVFALVALVAGWGLVKLFKVFNWPDGERYRRMAMQGSFVPLSKEDIEADRQRTHGRGPQA